MKDECILRLDSDGATGGAFAHQLSTLRYDGGCEKGKNSAETGQLL